MHHVCVWDGSEGFSSTYFTSDLTITGTRKLHLGPMPLHYPAWCFLLRLLTTEYIVTRNVWPSRLHLDHRHAAPIPRYRRLLQLKDSMA